MKDSDRIDSSDTATNGVGLETRGEKPEVLLFATPWMKAAWPSLALGCLKAYLREGGIETRCCHLHLEIAARIGWRRYAAFEETWGAGEALFGALFEPAEHDRLTSVASTLLSKAGYSEAAEWAECRGAQELSEIVEAWLDREHLESYPIVGGSVGAMQLCGSLYVMKRVTERGHAGKRILGGSALVGSVAREVLRRFTDVDAVIDGEGEQALLDFARLVRKDPEPSAAIPRVLVRDAAGRVAEPDAGDVLDFAAAPSPDLGEYFEAAAAFRVPTTALTLPLEYSRGCEWEHRTPGRLRGCSFCGLYRNSPNHRRQPVERFLKTILGATAQYRVLNLGFVDAYLPAGYRDELLEQLLQVPQDITFFTEMRCDFDSSTAARLAPRANRVQLGVESFSSAVLRRIGKGVGSAKSAYSVRLCQEFGIPAQYNLMTRIPGVTVEEIEELWALMPALFGLTPPTLTEFYLDRNSLMYLDPDAYGMDAAQFDVARPAWLAQSMGDSSICQVVPFSAPSDDPSAAAWDRVGAQVEAWKAAWTRARSADIESPLTWRDGAGWASIVDARTEVVKIYSIDGFAYDVFAACAEPTTIKELASRLPAYSATQIEEALQELSIRKLLLQDGAVWVALPVRAKPSKSNGG